MLAASLTDRAAERDTVWRDAVLALLIGVAAYALSCVIVAPDDEPHGFGIDWQLMSEAPFELRGRLPHRILAPLLAHGFGLGGANFLLFVRTFSVLLLATVFFHCRRRGLAVVDATLVTIAIAVTAAVQMYKLHWIGYPDALCYALFFGNLLAAKRPLVFWALFFVNLTNHELAAFLLPWLWFVRREANGSVRADLLGAGIALAGYGTLYFAVKALAPQQVFNAEYFAEHPLFPGGTVAVWAMAVTHLAVAFGPVLAVLGWHQAVRAHGRERWHLWLVVGGMVAIFCIAFDWARHTNLIVLPLVIASVRFLQAGHRAAYAALTALGVILMLWIPPWSPSAWPTCTMSNVKLLVDSGVVVPLPGQGPNDLNILFGPLSATLHGWLPQVWPMLTALAAIVAAIWLAGWWFARWSERRVLPRD